MKLRILLLTLCLTFCSVMASAQIQVVTTLPWIESLAGDIGKDKVRVSTLVKPNQDPHYVEAKPSMIVGVRRADVLMYNGLDLEVGYLPVLVESSRNPKVQPGTPGNLDCSQFVNPIERPVSVSRSMGDVHPLGNPHYHLSPSNIFRVAEGIAERLSGVDPANSYFYKRNLVSFQERFKERQKEWTRHDLRGKKFLPYHKFFEYMANEFGFEIVGYVEPKPGIPPSAGYVEKLIETIQKVKPDAILITNYSGEKEARFLSEKTGVKFIVVPHDVGATPACKDWFSLMDQILAVLK